MPSGPWVTAVRACVFVTIEKITSDCSAASRGDSAKRIPSAISGSALLRVRLYPVTSWPAESSLRATPPPITPSPT